MNIWTLKNSLGMSVEILSYGARITSIRYPMSNSHQEVLLSYPNITYIYDDSAYLNALVGRVANRIEAAQFTLSDSLVKLNANERGHCLHGGQQSFSHRDWELAEHSSRHILLALHSPDGDNGFPGAVDLTVRFSLAEDNRLRIEYCAEVEQTTPIDLTHHLYFTLGCSDIGQLQLSSPNGHRLLKNSDGISTGEASPFHAITSCRIAQLPFINDWTTLDDYVTFDELASHNTRASQGVKLSLYNPENGLAMNMQSSNLGVQFYSGGGLSAPLRANQGISIEPHGYPNAVNRDDFPTCLVTPDKPYQHFIEYHFEQLAQGVH